MKNPISIFATICFLLGLVAIDWSALPDISVQEAEAWYCGDGQCRKNKGECNSCPADCYGKSKCCGDGTCQPAIGECTGTICAADCSSGQCGPVCGDNNCESGECSSCPGDCDPCSDCANCDPVCGDNNCESGECSTCPSDCDLCSDCGDCSPVCGNHTCETSECATCPGDCNACSDCGECGIEENDDGCPQTAEPTSQVADTLRGFAETSDAGVVYDEVGAQLALKKSGGVFSSTTLGVTDLTVYAAVADFDGDGWDDFVGAGESRRFVRIYRNFSKDNLPVNWDDPNDILQPKFRNVREIYPDANSNRWHSIAAADFNGDGRPDVFISNAYAYENPYEAFIWLNNGNDGSGNPTFRNRYNAMASGTSASNIGYQAWSGTNVAAVDYNGDRKIDLLIGSGYGSGGSIRIFLNSCTVESPPPATPAAPAPLPCLDDPRFTYSGYLIRDMGLGSGNGELPVFAYEDFNRDGYRDLLVGSPDASSTSTKRLQLFLGQSGGGLSTTAQSISAVGAATAVLAADFSLDGALDVIVGSDNWNYGTNLGGISDYFANNLSGAPFSGGRTQRLTTYNNPTYDFDVGFVFDYDNDPDNTPDLMIADGNHTGSFYVFANRVTTNYVECGEVASGILDLGANSASDMVVTSARLSPDMYLPSGTSVTFYMSNETPVNWQEASACTDDPNDYCVAFPQPVGRDVRWKAVMCSNSTRTTTPTISGVEIKYDFTPAKEHYRAGVIVSDGVAYVGAFRQPGNRGHFYAINAGLSGIYWDAGAKLDAMADSDRNIYTATTAGNERLSFTTANSGDTRLHGTLNAANQAQAESVVAWQRSARFGIGGAVATTRLGSVENSTPAILVPPWLPLWYANATQADRLKIDAFMAAHTTRKKLVFFGSRDGALHAVRTTPTDPSNSKNGVEAWAFIPAKHAAELVSDMSNDTNSSYPDGSPTLADVKLGDGEMHTVLVMGSGNGGKSVFALDVTETIDNDSESVTGPEPLWHDTPGQGDAGNTDSKPAIARVNVGGNEKYLAILASGYDYSDLVAPYFKGRVVHAVDIETGALAWRFQAACPVTNNVVALETDDDLEPGDPEVDGFVDRVLFADACGYVYKLNPAAELSGNGAGDRWLSSDGLGSIDTGEVDPGGNPVYALFSTEHTSGAIGEQRPIPGTIAARSDASTRVVLFFGTGGVENFNPNVANEFYAVYADTGAIRSKMTGSCTAAGCEKFYGGVVVSSEQVILTRTIDPPIGQGLCEFGSSYVQGLDLNDNGGEFNQDFIQAIGSASVSSLYGDAGAIYFATLGGDIVRIGSPRASEAGGDSAAGIGPGTSEEGAGNTGGIGTDQPMTLMGWRQVF